MRYPKFYLLCVFFLLLTSCASYSFSSSDLLKAKTSVANMETFNMGGRAFVIIGTQNDLPAEGSSRFYAYFDIVDEKGEKVSEATVSLTEGTDSRNYMFMLNAGKYSLKNYRLEDRERYDEKRYRYKKLDLSDRYSFWFEVKDGEAVYLGDIVTMTKRGERENKKWYQDKYTDHVLINAMIIKDSSAYLQDLFVRVRSYTDKKVETRLMSFRDNTLKINQNPDNDTNKNENQKKR